MRTKKFFKKSMKHLKFHIKKYLTCYLAANILFLGMLPANTLSAYAAEITECDIDKEIAERESLGAEIYKFVDDDGNIMAYFEPYSEINPAPIITPRASSSINWVTDAKSTYISNVTRYFGQNQKIQLNSLCQVIVGNLSFCFFFVIYCLFFCIQNKP